MLKATKSISIQEVVFFELSCDEVGRVFFWNGSVFRAINKGYSEHIKELLSSDMFKELVGKGFLIDSWITDYELEGYDLVVGHRKVSHVTYVSEWAFSMLKAAALLVLKIVMIASDHGYYLKDCHPGNILFAGSQPIYIDIGSFVKRKFKAIGNRDCLFNYEEFLIFYYYPLKIYSYGDIKTAKKYYSCCNPHSFQLDLSYLLYRWPLLRLINPILERIVHLYFYLMRLPYKKDESIREESPNFQWLFLFLRRSFLLSRYATARYLSRKIHKITFRKPDKTKADTPPMYADNGKNTSTPCIEAVLDMIDSRGISSIVQFGISHISFPEELMSRTSVKDVTCIDDDIYAIEREYAYLIKKGSAINLAVVDLMNSDLYERLKAEAIIALSLTYYKMRKMVYSVDFLLESLAKYTTDYVFIEFVLNETLDRSDAMAPSDELFNKEKLRKAFEKYLYCIDELEFGSRILLVGRLQGKS
jgi:hypothetical protein